MEEQYYLGRNVIAEWMQSQQTKGSANTLYTAQILVLLLLPLLLKKGLSSIWQQLQNYALGSRFVEQDC